MNEIISFEDIMKVEMRVGEIVEAEEMAESEKLIRMRVNFGEEMGERIIFAGIKKWYEPKQLVGKRTAFFMNLKPKKMGNMGESQGMLVAVEVIDGDERRAVMLEPDREVPLGARII